MYHAAAGVAVDDGRKEAEDEKEEGLADEESSTNLKR